MVPRIAERADQGHVSHAATPPDVQPGPVLHGPTPPLSAGQTGLKAHVPGAHLTSQAHANPQSTSSHELIPSHVMAQGPWLHVTWWHALEAAHPMVQFPLQSTTKQRSGPPAHSTLQGPLLQSNDASWQVPAPVQWMSHPPGGHFIFTGTPT